MQGEVAPGFEGVCEALENSFAAGREAGAQVVAFANGERVVDLWAGASHPGGEPLGPDSLACVFSCTKVRSSRLCSSWLNRTV